MSNSNNDQINIPQAREAMATSRRRQHRRSDGKERFYYANCRRLGPSKEKYGLQFAVSWCMMYY